MRVLLCALFFCAAACTAPTIAGDAAATSRVQADSACPPPTLAEGGQCVLTGDVVLDRTLRLPSSTKLNCEGHSLTPAVAGVLDDPRTDALEFEPSQPDLAVFVYQAHDVKVQDCVISGFDLGILVADSKTDGSQPDNKILGNTIDVRTNPIDLMRADAVLIADNTLVYAAERGRGIVVEMDSDDNQLVDNTIVSTDLASTGLVNQLPGGPLVATQTAIMDNQIHCLEGDRPMHSFVIDAPLPSRTLIQIAAAYSTVDPDGSTRPDHNLIQGNAIIGDGVGPTCKRDPTTPCSSNSDCPGEKGGCLLKQNSGIAFNIRATDSVVVDNTISGRHQRGISFGGVPSPVTIPNWYPGHCEGASGRMCVDETDCYIPGYDAQTTGPCLDAQPVQLDGNTVGLVAEANELSGVYGTAALFSNNTHDFTMEGNLVQVDTSTASGIRTGRTAIDGIIQRNVVEGSFNGLFLTQPSGAELTDTIRLNDFTDYEFAIRTTPNYDVPTRLGGNYWGQGCPGLDPSLVVFDGGGVNPWVTDDAYGVPVASTPDDLLPAPCE